MTRDELEAVAVALLGEGWKNPLADATGINRRSIGKMAAGEKPVPPRLADALTAASRVLTMLAELTEEHGPVGANDEIRIGGDDRQLADWTKAVVAAALRNGGTVQ